MRKQNSSFKTAFITDEGSKLKNNDYFAYIELDHYACYCIADGITNLRDSESAKEAIHTIISEFQARPSMSGGAIRGYLRAANREMQNRKSYEKLQASVTVVITDYEALRYAYAGNTRLKIYRDGRLFHATKDMSLSQELVAEEKIPQDLLARHEERHNLHTYLGKAHFTPFISPKIKLRETDIIALYTKGIWENIDEGELNDIFEDAGTEPGECCAKAEDMMTSRDPGELGNYTLAAVFVEKVFHDPNRKKRIKRIIIISIIAALVILVIAVVIYIVYRIREDTKAEMDLSYRTMLEYIEDDNFVRAEEVCGETAELAKKLSDQEMRELLLEYRTFLEAVIKADDIFAEGKYIESEEAYLSAKVRSRYADNAGIPYIDQKLEQINRYRDVYDNIVLGDKLLEQEEYGLAEEKYLMAKEDAASVYFEDGKQQALDALEALYEEWAAAQEEEKTAAADQAAAEVAAAELVKQGDEAYAAGDYEGSMVFYLIGLEKYTKLEDAAQIAQLNRKIINLNDKQEEVAGRVAEAKLFEEQARLYTEEGLYDQAKEQYQYARNIYQEIGKDSRGDEMQGKIDIVDTKVKQQEKEQAEQEKEEEKAREAAQSVSGNATGE